MQAINVNSVDLQLPCPENIFAFEEPYIGFKIKDILSVNRGIHHNDVLPFFITATYLWGNVEEQWLLIIVDLETSIRSPDLNTGLQKANTELDEWITGLPKRMQWSENNYKLHKNLGQGKVFVTMHFLLHHAKVLGHIEYLPQLDDPTMLSDQIDSSGLSINYQNSQLISSCLSCARAITETATLLYKGTDQDRENLRSPIVANALILASAIHLWSHHVGSHQSGPCNGSHMAKAHFDLLVEIIASWRQVWKVEKAWAETLSMLANLYDSAYGGQVVVDTIFDNMNVERSQIATSDSHAKVETFHTASIGDGIQDPAKVPQRLHHKLRLAIAMAMVSSENREKLKRVFLGTLWQHMAPTDVFPSPSDMLGDIEATSITFTDWIHER